MFARRCVYDRNRPQPSATVRSRPREGPRAVPIVQPVVWECDGCKHNRHRAHESHTNGPDCRWSIARTVAEGSSTERSARHPRDGRVPASSDPTAVLRLENRDDGVPGEALDERADPAAPEALTPEEAERRRAEKASPSSGPVRRRLDAATQVNAPDPPPATEGAIVPRDDPEHQVAVPGWSKYDWVLPYNSSGQSVRAWFAEHCGSSTSVGSTVPPKG